MINALAQYVNILVIVSIIVSLLMTIAPKGSTKAAIGLISSLAVVVTLLAPALSLKNLNLDLSEWLTESAEPLEQNNFNDTRDKLLKELIVDKTSAYILSKAQALGIECRVDVMVEGDTPVPTAAAVYGAKDPGMEAQKQLSEFLAFECGIPKENQCFTWKPEIVN